MSYHRRATAETGAGPGHPFIDDARIDGLRDTYMGLRSFGQGRVMAIETLAEKLGVSERTVQYHIKRMKALGVLEVEKQFQDGRQRTNLYLFPTPIGGSRTRLWEGYKERYKVTPYIGVIGVPMTWE